MSRLFLYLYPMLDTFKIGIFRGETPKLCREREGSKGKLATKFQAGKTLASE